MASAFMDVLAAVRRGHELHGDIGELKACIHRCRNRHCLQEAVNLCSRVTDRMAQHYLEQYAMGQQQSWTSAFKELSHLGFDIRKGRIVDYGNYEYIAILQSFALMDHKIMDHLAELGRGWELDLWRVPKSDSPVEKLGDVIECFFAHLRGDGWTCLIRDIEELPQMLDFFTGLCQLVQRLNGHFCTGWLKYKEEYITHMTKKLPCDFVSAWCTGYQQHKECCGLLLWSLLHV